MNIWRSFCCRAIYVLEVCALRNIVLTCCNSSHWVHVIVGVGVGACGYCILSISTNTITVHRI